MEKKKEVNRYENLKAKFPNSAYGKDKSRGFELTTIDAYAVIERLNDVFGVCGEGWKLEIKEWLRIEQEIICIAELQYDLGGVLKSVPCVGGKRIVKENYADAYKSAQTNAICKGASFIGVGLDVYKGEFSIKDHYNNATSYTKPATKPAPTSQTQQQAEPKKEYTVDPNDTRVISDKQRKRFYKIGKDTGWTDEEMLKLIKGCGYEHSKDIQRKDYENICNLLEKNVPDISHEEPNQEELLAGFKEESDKTIAGYEDEKKKQPESGAPKINTENEELV